MTTDIDTRHADGDVVVSGGALAIRPDQTSFSPAQKAALGHIGLANAPEGDVSAFLHLCQRTGLDPWSRQIYLIERAGKWTPQTAIDGFRVIAERRPEYKGQTAPEWCGEDGEWRTVWLDKKPPAAARVGILRSDRDDPVWGIAVFSEFAQYKSGGGLTSMWDTKSSHMIAKCAEAAGFRKAFPQDIAGLVTGDEADAFERAQARTRVVSQRVPSGPVDNSELTGTPSALAAKRAAPEKPDDRMSSEQQKTLLRLIREAQVGDSKAYASHLLGRKVTSLGQLTQGDAVQLIDNLEAMLAGDDEPAQGELVETPADGTVSADS